MKKAITILLAILATQLATAVSASAEGSETSATYTVVLAGGAAESMIEIRLSADGRYYEIISVAPLEVGGTVCENAPGTTTVLLCKAPMVAGFEVNAGSGDDSVTVDRDVLVPVTLRGGPGNDALVGGGGPDKLIGGPGNDRLVGRAGDDLIFGGPGNDSIFGGPGMDTLRGGPGRDVIVGGPGENSIRQD
jgi:RTX calcium-binding nonapeptide repeat (4 copies)